MSEMDPSSPNGPMLDRVVADSTHQSTHHSTQPGSMHRCRGAVNAVASEAAVKNDLQRRSSSDVNSVSDFCERTEPEPTEPETTTEAELGAAGPPTPTGKQSTKPADNTVVHALMHPTTQHSLERNSTEGVSLCDGAGGERSRRETPHPSGAACAVESLADRPAGLVGPETADTSNSVPPLHSGVPDLNTEIEVISPGDVALLSDTDLHCEQEVSSGEVSAVTSPTRRPRFLVQPALNTGQLKNGAYHFAPHGGTRLAPPDGGWGWVVLAASVSINILIPGFIKSFGVMFDDVAVTFNASTAQVSWIPALIFFMYNFMGLVAGALCQRYSCRVTATLGGLLASSGLLVSHCAGHIYYLYVGLGLMGGAGGCFVYSAGVLVVGSYFERRRGLANGLCVSGSALGAMVFPPLLDLLLEYYGFSDSMLVLCGALLHVVPCAALYRPVARHMVRVPADPAAEPPPSVSPAGTASSLGSVHSLQYLSTVLHGSALAVSQKRGSDQLLAAARRRRTPLPPPPEPAQQERPLIELTLLWNPVFLLMLTSSALFQVSVSNLLVILPSYSTHVGYSRQQASLLLSVFAGCDLAGRIGGAALSDLKLVPRRVFLLGAYLLTGLALALLPAGAAALYAAAALAVAAAGVGTGIVMGIYSVMLIEYLGLERLGSTYGLSVCLMGVALLGGPPLFGLVRQRAPSPHLVIYLLATLPLLSAAVWLLMPAAQAHCRRRQQATAV